MYDKDSEYCKKTKGSDHLDQNLKTEYDSDAQGKSERPPSERRQQMEVHRKEEGLSLWIS